jgi:hypothetical protein
MRALMLSIFLYLIIAGGTAMAAEPTMEEQTAQLRKQAELLAQELVLLKAQATLESEKRTLEMKSAIEVLTQELNLLKARATLDSEKRTLEMKSATEVLTQELNQLKAKRALDQEKQTQEALTAKALLDALKDQTVSQYALGAAQAQLPFAELQGIKAGISGLTLPSGKEGTVKVTAGTAGTALLRSKRPMLELLDKVADELVTLCPSGAALLTEAQLGQANTAEFTLKRIEDEKIKLAEAAQKATPVDPRAARVPGVTVPAIIAGAYAFGLTLDTINSLLKLLRTNRQLDVFSADAEAIQMLGYLLESKGSKGKEFVAYPAMLGKNVITEAESLMKELKDLATRLQVGNDTLAKIKKYSDDIAKAPAGDPIKQVEMPSDAAISLLKAEIEVATSLLDSINPSKKPDAFWTQVSGQLLAANIKGKQRLFIEAKAQTVQVTESRWYASDRILATSEVQVAYRLFDKDGSLIKASISLKASKSSADDAQIDKLDELAWPNAGAAK